MNTIIINLLGSSFFIASFVITFLYGVTFRLAYVGSQYH